MNLKPKVQIRFLNRSIKNMTCPIRDTLLSEA